MKGIKKAGRERAGGGGGRGERLVPINEFCTCRYGLTIAQGTTASKHQKSNSNGFAKGWYPSPFSLTCCLLNSMVNPIILQCKLYLSYDPSLARTI